MLLLVFRFVIFAAIYCAIVLWWALRSGHGGMGIVAGGILTSGALVIAWILAIVAARFVVLPFVRLAIHVAVVFVLFTAGSTGSFSILDYREPLTTSAPFSVMRYFDFALTLGGIAAVAAFVDGLVGLWKERRSGG